MAARLSVKKVQPNAQALNLGKSKVYHLPDWHKMSHPQRLGVIRRIAMQRGRDPRIAQLAVSIIKDANIPPRNYVGQAAAILAWVQNPDNIYYVNEPGERLQDPIYTIQQGHADCDDQVLVLCALFESVGLPWKLVLSGRGHHGKMRYIEGQVVPLGVTWTHIYCMVGDKPFRPAVWYYAEPTVQGVPLGWDVVSGDHRFLPEMSQPTRGPARIADQPTPGPGFRPSPLPSKGQVSPAYATAYGGFSAGVIGGAIAEEVEKTKKIDWRSLGAAIFTGVAVSVSTTLILDFIRGHGIHKDKGSVVSRMQKAAKKVVA